MRHFDVQILGGVALVNGSIAEMQTGEGKTLTATLPLYLHALAGEGERNLCNREDYPRAPRRRMDAPVVRVTRLVGRA